MQGFEHAGIRAIICESSVVTHDWRPPKLAEALKLRPAKVRLSEFRSAFERARPALITSSIAEERRSWYVKTHSPERELPLGSEPEF